MRVAVIGATGALGRHLVPRLVERGHQVRATYRRGGEALCRSLGAEPARADVLEPASLKPVVDGCDAAVHIATSIPRPGGSGDWGTNDRIRREGTANLVAACRAAGVARYLQQSIAMLHAADDRALRTEDSAIVAYDRIRSAVEMEETVTGSTLDWRIVRGAAFYGPLSGREEQWRAALAAGALKLPADGDDYISLIHVADMAAALVVALESAETRQAYIAADDCPVTYKELFTFLAGLLGATPPAGGGPRLLPSFRVANTKLKTLGWRPFYPTFRSGFAAL